MTDADLLTEQIEAVRADIAAVRGAEVVNHRDLSTLRVSLADLLAARRRAVADAEASHHREWLRLKERELADRGWGPLLSKGDA